MSKEGMELIDWQGAVWQGEVPDSTRQAETGHMLHLESLWLPTQGHEDVGVETVYIADDQGFQLTQPDAAYGRDHLLKPIAPVSFGPNRRILYVIRRGHYTEAALYSGGIDWRQPDYSKHFIWTTIQRERHLIKLRAGLPTDLPQVYGRLSISQGEDRASAHISIIDYSDEGQRAITFLLGANGRPTHTDVAGLGGRQSAALLASIGIGPEHMHKNIVTPIVDPDERNRLFAGLLGTLGSGPEGAIDIRRTLGELGRAATRPLVTLGDVLRTA